MLQYSHIVLYQTVEEEEKGADKKKKKTKYQRLRDRRFFIGTHLFQWFKQIN